jgi:uncharacterized protein (DUF2235 family)
MKKRLILCCDGTWNSADQESNGRPCPTNVIKIAYRLCKHGADGTPQIVYYDQGVGTGNWLDRIEGGATGLGLEQNIHDAYIFLLANYDPGDDIYIFGFSRGAYTARSIGGMIRKCGILKRQAVRRYHEAELLYHNADVHPDDEPAVTFRKEASLLGGEDVPVKMVGVWDTVGALGIPLRGLRAHNKKEFQFYDTSLSRTVEYAFHALAVDERRAPFEPTLWKYEPKPSQKAVEQVWFPGVHSDVGGGYDHKQDEPLLSDYALEWMIDCAKRAGLEFDADVMATYPTNPSPKARLHDSRTAVYHLQPAYVRPIGIDDPTQRLHESVSQRWDADEHYRPENVRDYFKRTGDPRGNAA